MTFPPELIDRILKYLRDDPRSLSASSLVSKVWTSWGRAYLFESVHLAPPNLRRWVENISPDIDGPASYTRTLTLEEYRLLPWINPQYSDFPLSNLASFTNVRFLTLVQWNATLFNDASLEPYFGHFGKSVGALNLRFCTLEPPTLYNFLSLLPNVQDLGIACPSPSGSFYTMPDVPEVTPSFRGTLSLADFNSDHPVLKAVAALPLHFTTISIRGCTFYEPEAYQMLLTGCRDTLVTLRFEGSYRDRPVPDVSLASCDRLEEIHILLGSNRKLTQSVVNLLSSTTSKTLRNLSLSFIEFVNEGDSDSDDEDEDDRSDEDDGIVTWDSLDTTLCHLAKRVSEAEGRLTLQLNSVWPRRDSVKPVKFGHLLSRFLKYGGLDVDYT